MRRLALTCSLIAALAPAAAEAQDMDLAISRLRVDAVDRTTVPAGTPCATDFDATGRGVSFDHCLDNDAWRRVMTQFGGAMIPPLLAPAGTRGVRGIYVGFETWLNPIENDASNAVGDSWHRAVEGDGMGASTSRSRFVDNLLAWGRFNVRKGLPFGFDLGMNIGYLANTSYWTLGLEIRWSLFEGFRDGVGWIPDLAVRGAVQTLMGDAEFNVTVPSVDIILSEPIVIANTVEITPSIYGQVAWIFADSELVDLTPETPVFSGGTADGRTVPGCNPNPRTPTAGNPDYADSSPYCRLPPDGSTRELHHNVVFDDLRSTRFRLGGGLQIRYEWFQLSGSFLFDVLRPSDMDGELPDDLPRQMQINLGAGVSL